MLTVVDAGGSGTRLIVYKLIDKVVEERVECEGKIFFYYFFYFSVVAIVYIGIHS